MENNQNDYHVSFFKPVTEKARRNRNMVIWLVVIWATAVFGFQILLRIVEKPVPEPAYTSFLSVWDNVESGDYESSDLKVFANSVLGVLGKVYVKPLYKDALYNAFNWSVFQLAKEDAEKLGLLISNFRELSENSSNITDPDYVNAKNALEYEVSVMLGVGDNDPKRLVIPFVMSSESFDQFTETDKETTEKAMGLYLIHNRSFLTDARFLGFPFHYFYTAVFLLTLFIGLCWAYCFITDRRQSKEPLPGVEL